MNVPSEVALVERLLSFAESYGIESKFEDFANKYIQLFTFDIDEEQPLELQSIFESYEQLYEDMIQAFLDDEEITPRELYQILSMVQQEKDSSSYDNLAIILSALDYEIFGMRMLKEARDQQQAAKEASDMGF
ncbi:hypothetical protein THRCLA_20823 [Thraustotheca clavata]|uniref:Cilia- and flagella-associated protein 36 n=1 Tax=Thraustotheca clavata TaxID=74557 RepID=A0A1W0A397_9STRA|nr:hypothetical protein THRCLA_20823 [Thraustotheca clavata]